jgi:hypothetical protein
MGKKTGLNRIVLVMRRSLLEPSMKFGSKLISQIMNALMSPTVCCTHAFQITVEHQLMFRTTAMYRKVPGLNPAQRLATSVTLSYTAY